MSSSGYFWKALITYNRARLTVALLLFQLVGFWISGVIFVFLEGKLFQADAIDVREEDLGLLHSSDICALNPDKSLMPQQHTHWEDGSESAFTGKRHHLKTAHSVP